MVNKKRYSGQPLYSIWDKLMKEDEEWNEYMEQEKAHHKPKEQEKKASEEEDETSKVLF